MNLTLPIYVETIRQAGSAVIYQGRPLFFSDPVVRSDRLDRMLTKLAQDLGQRLTLLGRAGRHETLAGYTLYPALGTHRLDLNVPLRRQTLRGRFLFVVLRQFGRRIAFTPSIPDLWFDVTRSEQLRDRATEVLARYLREREKEDSDFDASSYPLNGTAHVMPLEIAVRPPAVPPQPKESRFLFLGDAEPMDGAVELRRIGRCLDWLYPDELDRVQLRETEVTELTRCLDVTENRPVLLLGPRQVGKTALIHEYVHQQVSRRSSPYKDHHNVWLVAPARLISGMSFVGQWENRLLAILKEAKRRRHILYFDDLLGLFQAGRTSQSSLSVAGVLKPYLERREVRIWGEITPEAWRVLREQDRGFADLFHVLPIAEPNEAATLHILIAVQRHLENQHRCRFDLEVLPTVLDLQRRYNRDTAFPGKAATFLRRLGIKHRKNVERPESSAAARDSAVPPPAITRADALTEFHAHSGLALTFLDQRSRLDRQEVLDALTKNLVGQDAALHAAADAIAIARARLNDPDRPLATFLFLGPTGVGKTQCAKAIAAYLFGDPDRLVRIDLNEFGEPGSAARLVGTFNQPEGILTSAIRRQPFAVVLFDEAEKAHSEVFDLLLQVLGEGRLTDALGRTADFSNALIVLTSNLGVREAEGRFGFRQDEAAAAAVFVQAAERFFRPEFFNRLDRVIPFRRLSIEHVQQIARKLIHDVFGREGLIQRKHVVRIEEQAMSWIVERGYDPVLGARAMKRAIERELTHPLAAQLAAQPSGSFTAVHVYAGAGQLIVHSQALEQITPQQPRQLPREKPELILQRFRMAIAAIEDEIAPHRPSGAITLGDVTPEQMRYFALREQVQRARDTLRRAGDQVEAWTQPHSFPSYRKPDAVRSHRFLGKWNTSDNAFLRELAAAMNINEYLRDLHESSVLIDSGPIDWRDLSGQTALLQIMAQSLRAGQPERAILWLRDLSGATENSQAMLDNLRRGIAEQQSLWLQSSLAPEKSAQAYLFVRERDALRRLHLEIAEWPPRQSKLWQQGAFLLAEGLHALPIAMSEAGVHLFCPPHDTLKLIQIDVMPVPAHADPDALIKEQLARRNEWLRGLQAGEAKVADDPLPTGPLIRLYDANGIIDLRTGHIGETSGLHELMLAGLPLPKEITSGE